MHSASLTLFVATLALSVPAAPQSSSVPGGAEAVSLFGKPFVSRPPSPEVLKTLEANLAQARAAYEKSPNDPEAVIWLGRRTAYLGRYRDAVAIFSKGLDQHPRYAKLYRHRGHRLITLRQFDAAEGDLSRAADLIAGTPDEIEPDGAPNARNIPTSTSHANICYHLGLARYLSGDFEGARAAYWKCLEYSKNPDMLTATTHWLYMTLRRLGKDEEARKVLEPISENMEIIENGSYHQLLLMYQGKKTADALLSTAAAGLDATTIGYGVANWYLYNGRRDEAIALLKKILDGADQWAAFGYIAAEADLKRLQP